MGKLDKVEIAIIVFTVWGAAFLTALIYTQDWVRALGSSVWCVLLGFAVVGTINKRRQKVVKTN